MSIDLLCFNVHLTNWYAINLQKKTTNMVSSDIAWAVIRDSSSFLLKKRGVKKPFSTEPCNLTNRNAQRFNGLVNNKVVGISAAADNKG